MLASLTRSSYTLYYFQIKRSSPLDKLEAKLGKKIPLAARLGVFVS